MRRIVNDISNGKNIKENLYKYQSEMKMLYNRYAFVRLAMNYYTYYQIALDGENINSNHKQMADGINHVIRDGVLSDVITASEAVKILDNNRKSLMEDVSALTYYVDVFKIYEHSLNRIEYRFKEDELPKDYSDEELCRMLMQFIVEDEDSVVVNSKISEIIAELPIRMTKSKFYEHVANGLSIYKGTQKKTLEDFLYMIRTSSMLGAKESYGERFPELEETMDAFTKADFAEMNKEEYEMLFRSIEDVSVYIEDVMNISMMLMEIMNDAYSVLLTKNAENDGADEKEMLACKEIIADVNDYFILGSELDESTEDMFVVLEGSQENIYQKLSVYNIYEEIESVYKSEIKEVGLESEFEDLGKLGILSSDSIFVELELVQDDATVDDVVLDEEREKLIAEFADLFSKKNKYVNRAVMSTVLAQLPVFFNNISELQDFIYNTLSGCKDKAEKLACIEVLNQIMED